MSHPVHVCMDLCCVDSKGERPTINRIQIDCVTGVSGVILYFAEVKEGENKMHWEKQSQGCRGDFMKSHTLRRNATVLSLGRYVGR